MPNFYHGSRSTTVIDKPSSDFVGGENSFNIEYGWGFYGGDCNDALERLHTSETTGRQEGVIYKIHVPDDEFNKNWIKVGQPIGQDIYDRLQGALKNHPQFADSLKKITPNSTGSEVTTFARGFRGGTAKEGAAFLNDAGIQGYKSDSYAVFYKPENVKLEPDQGYGAGYEKIVNEWKEKNAPQQSAAPSQPPASRNASPPEPASPAPPPSAPTASNSAPPVPNAHEGSAPPALNRIGAAYEKSGEIASETLGQAFDLLKEAGGQVLADKFRSVLDQLHTGPNSQREHGNGYDVRETVGNAVKNALKGTEGGTTPANLEVNLKYIGVDHSDPQLYGAITGFFKSDLAPYMKGPFAAGATAAAEGATTVVGAASRAGGTVMRAVGPLGMVDKLTGLGTAADVKEGRPAMENLADGLVKSGKLSAEAADYYKGHVLDPALADKSFWGGMGGLRSPGEFQILRDRYKVSESVLQQLDPTGGELAHTLPEITASLDDPKMVPPVANKRNYAPLTSPPASPGTSATASHTQKPGGKAVTPTMTT